MWHLRWVLPVTVIAFSLMKNSPLCHILTRIPQGSVATYRISLAAHMTRELTRHKLPATRGGGSAPLSCGWRGRHAGSYWGRPRVKVTPFLSEHSTVRMLPPFRRKTPRWQRFHKERDKTWGSLSAEPRASCCSDWMRATRCRSGCPDGHHFGVRLLSVPFWWPWPAATLPAGP